MSTKYLIKAKRNIFKVLLANALNVVMWIYVITAVMLFVTGVLDLNTEGFRILKAVLKITNEEIRVFVIISIVWFTISFLILWIWNRYNYRRYGKLNRRKYPGETTREEILKLDLISPEIYTNLQENKIIILETSPVRDISRGDRG